MRPRTVISLLTLKLVIALTLAHTLVLSEAQEKILQSERDSKSLFYNQDAIFDRNGKSVISNEEALDKHVNLRSGANNETDMIPYIVGLRQDFQPEGLIRPEKANSQRAAIQTLQDKLLTKLNGKNIANTKRFQFIPYLALTTDAQGLKAILALPEVISVVKDIPIPAALSRSVPIIGAPGVWARGATGSGKSIAILDTGVDKNHPFLAGKVVSEACYSTNNPSNGSTSLCPNGVTQSIAPDSGLHCTNPTLSCAHGTHVAGIAAGKRDDGFSGVAKDASLIAMQVFTRIDSAAICGQGNVPCIVSYISDQIRGLERVQALSETLSIASVNLSLGGGGSGNCDLRIPAYKAAIDNLRSLGIPTVIASGNDGGINFISYPACISTAISVGSSNLGIFEESVSDFSNSSKALNLLAPGNITSSVPSGGFMPRHGTSMAAPHVAGAWALLKQQLPNASVEQIFMALKNTGQPLTDNRNAITKPRIQVDAALNFLTCGYAIDPISQIIPMSGGAGTINVTAGTGCAWTASGEKSIFNGRESFAFLGDRNSKLPGTPNNAIQYPNKINVSGLSGTITKVTATLGNVYHDRPDDFDILLVGPQGQRSLLMSDVGGSFRIFFGLVLSFDQEASNVLPDDSVLRSGTYRPSNYSGNATLEPGGTDYFPTPGPGQNNYTADLSVFNGTNPNGDWSLYVVDDETGLRGDVFTWSIDITTNQPCISITSGNSGTGNGVVTYSVLPSGTYRKCSVTVAGQTFTMTQSTGNTVQATVGTNIPGLPFLVDGNIYTTTQTFTWVSGSPHSIVVAGTENGSGILTSFTNWSDASGVGATRTVSPTANTTYTANFRTQYRLTTIAGANGRVTPTSRYFNSGETVQITATPDRGFGFTGWTGTGNGSYTGPNNIATVTMNEPITQTATFTTNQCSYSISRTGQNFAATGGTGTVQVNASNGCAWTAISNVNSSTQHNNNSSIPVADSAHPSVPGVGNPYPSNINVSGIRGNISKLAVTLKGITHAHPDDLDIMLIGPGGQSAFLMSDAGANVAANGVNLTFDQSAATSISDTGALISGTYKPINYTGDHEFAGNDEFLAPIPFGTSRASDLNVFNGTNPNGTWSLFILDDQPFDAGSLTGGWSLEITINSGSSWLNLTCGNNGTGNGEVCYSLSPNTESSARRETLTIAGQTFSVCQNGTTQSCSNNKSLFDFDGDSKADIGLFRPSTGVWWIQQSVNNLVNAYAFGISTDKLVPADYDGDGKTDIAVWRPGTGQWFVLKSSDSAFFAAHFGTNGDVPAPGDFDADGKADFVVFRPSNGTWYLQQSTAGFSAFQFGLNGDVPVVGDYDNDRKSDVAIFRPSTGYWWIQRSTAGLLGANFGLATDKPVAGDYTGDGKTDIAVWRPSNGYWYVLKSEDTSFYGAQFGMDGDVPVGGDYDGDGKADLAVFRPAGGAWYIQRSTQGFFTQQFGVNGDIPVSTFTP